VTLPYPDAGSRFYYVPTVHDVKAIREHDRLHERGNAPEYVYHPFQNEEDYNLAEWLTQYDVPESEIDELLKAAFPLPESTRQSLGSAHTLKGKLESMDGGLGKGAWNKHKTELQWNAHHDEEPIEFWYRDPIAVAKWLLGQPCNSRRLVYHPEKRFVDGHREYSEMNTGTWWWEEQDKLSSGSTLVPILLFSDSTHLTNFSGDKKAWPVYMSIGNLNAATRMKPTTRSVVMIALLPQTFKHSAQGPEGRNEKKQSRFNDEIIHEVLAHLWATHLGSYIIVHNAICVIIGDRGRVIFCAQRFLAPVPHRYRPVRIGTGFKRLAGAVQTGTGRYRGSRYRSVLIGTGRYRH
jgi:hypothetical protein